MATLSLKISLEGGAVTKTIQFDPQINVFDACKIIREKFAEAIHGKRKFFFKYFVLTAVPFVHNRSDRNEILSITMTIYRNFS